jgi:hypothetical protein
MDSFYCDRKTQSFSLDSGKRACYFCTMLLLLQHILFFYAQAAPHSSFDVLSVKAASPNRPGGRIRYAVIWLDDDWFQIDATMPADTAEDQFRTMMQHLLGGPVADALGSRANTSSP